MTVFNLESFCNAANSGEQVDLNGFINFVNGYENVILWGAGNLGTAIGVKFIELGIKLTAYWDIRANQVGIKNGVQVMEPFSGSFNKNKSLVIFCIANVPVGPNLYRQLFDNKWPNIIKGTDVLQGIICPLSKETELNTQICNQYDMCTVCSCQRLDNIVKHKVMERERIPEDEILSFDRIHMIVNNFCNLKCTHCFLYMNSYPNERKKNVPLNRILKDIDAVFEAVHSFGVVNVFGGETFLHPEISKIVKKILEKKNFGSAVVSTNGTLRIKESQLEGFQDPRLRLAFSNYIGSLSEEQENLFKENIKFAISLGVNAKSQNELPNWNKSSTLDVKDANIEILKQKKSTCGVVFLYVFDGKVFPCAFSLSIYDLGIADYKSDYVDISSAKSREDLRHNIREMVNRTHFSCCAHCGADGSDLATKAGEQGFDERYKLPILK